MRTHFFVAGALLFAGCADDAHEAEHDAIGAQGPVPVNGNPELLGVFDNPSGRGSIRRVRLLPCWMDITFKDGSVRAGNYSAFADTPEASTGILEELVPLASGGGAHTDLWFLSWEWTLADASPGSPPSVKQLVLQSVNSPVSFGDRSVLVRTGDTDVSEDMRWCLSGPLPGQGVAPDGRGVVVPVGNVFANESLIGMWQGEGRLTDLRVAPCWMEVDYEDGVATRGSFAAHAETWNPGGVRGWRGADSVAIIDMDLAERVHPWVTTGSNFEDPPGGILFAVHRSVGADRMDILWPGLPAPETLTRMTTWTPHPDRWCIP